MHKLVAPALGALLVLSLASCGGSKTTSPAPADPAGAAAEVNLATEALAGGDYASANAHFTAALAMDPGNDQAQFGVAVTDVFLVQSDAEVQDIMTFLDVVPPPVAPGGRQGAPRLGALTLGGGKSFAPVSLGRAVSRMLALAVQDPPAVSDIQRVIKLKVLPKLQNAENRLNDIEQASEFVFKLPPAATGAPDTIEIDMSDVLLLDGMVNAVQGWLGVVVAYNFDVPNSDFQHVDAESLLAPGTDWATLHADGGVQLAAARSNLLLVNTRFDAAAASLTAETDDQSDDVVPQAVLATPGFQDLAAGIDQAAASLQGPVPVDVRDASGQPFTFQFHVGRFFVPAIQDLKTKLPDHTFDSFGKPQLVAPITFPDPTINGIFPDMTDARWQQLTGVTGPVARAMR